MKASPLLLGLAVLLAACGSAASGGTTPAAPAKLTVDVQNTSLLVGEDRLGLALMENKKAVLGADATVTVVSGKTTVEKVHVEFAGHEYKDIPYYLGAFAFPQQGVYHLLVDATLRDGRHGSGSNDVLVTTKAAELPIGFKIPALKQPVAKDVGGDLSKLDSGVPPDDWHTATVADGLAQHRAMVVYFGEPGRCASQTCGPTVAVLQELCKQFCDRMLFEHIEVHYPASADATNPAFAELGFQSEPWVYFVNADGVVADRYEGPVTLAQVIASAQGTLAGKVPAVDVNASSS